MNAPYSFLTLFSGRVEITHILWQYNTVDVIPAHAEKALNEDADELMLLLFFDAVILTVSEAYPGSIETIIINTCTQTVAITAIPETVQPYFDPAEIKAG